MTDSDRLTAFLSQGWAPRPPVLPDPDELTDCITRATARRRAALLDQDFGPLAIPLGREISRAHDTLYAFRPSSDAVWLTGWELPDAVLCLDDGATLFVPESLDMPDPAAFTDRLRGAIWVAPCPSPAEVEARTGIRCAPRAELDEWLAAHPDAYYVAEPAVHLDDEIAHLPEHLYARSWISRQRLVKDDLELDLLRQACDATRTGFAAVGSRLTTLDTEKAAAAVFRQVADSLARDLGYPTIAGGGPNACVLHWSRNTGRLTPGQGLLLDAGCEVRGCYTADVTRTLPAGGVYSAPQRDVVDAVAAAQSAALERVRAGAGFRDADTTAKQVLAEALVAWGVVASLDEALDPDCPKHVRYTAHGVSHHLGIDVHDAPAAEPDDAFGPLVADMVITVEPGLYFQPHDLTVPEHLRGIAARIEDDVRVTPTGYELLSSGLPYTAAECEAWVAELTELRGPTPD